MRLFESVRSAALALAEGRLVAFPTETVYGLGADATNADAVAHIFRVKGRPPDHPLIVHTASAEGLDRFAVDVPDGARRLARAFWPGPLTIIVNRRVEVTDADPPVADETVGGRGTVGLRVPDHPVALELLAEFAAIGSGAVAAPSANRFGAVSPTTVDHVVADLGHLPAELTDRVGVIDGGPCPVGVESTIVDLTRPRPELLRPGGISTVELAAVLGEDVVDGRGGERRASGMLAAHYAPRAEVRLVAAPELDAVLELLPPDERFDTGVIAPFAVSHRPSWHLPADAAGYARQLYSALRDADRAGLRRLLVVAPSRGSMVEAVVDRLTKAAVGSFRRDE
jgi:L-threonylcarbamoyladenylate synthase